MCEKTRNRIFSLPPAGSHTSGTANPTTTELLCLSKRFRQMPTSENVLPFPGAPIYSLNPNAASVSQTLCSKSSQASISTRLFFARNGIWLPFYKRRINNHVSGASYAVVNVQTPTLFCVALE